VDRAFELHPGGMQAGLHGAAWDTEDISDLVEWRLVEIAKREQRTLSRIDAIKSANDEISLCNPVIKGLSTVRGPRLFLDCHLQSRSTAPGTSDSATLIDQDPRDPSVKSISFTKGADLTPCNREGVLDRISRVWLVAGDRRS
jgi:hypothetical protein